MKPTPPRTPADIRRMMGWRHSGPPSVRSALDDPRFYELVQPIDIIAMENDLGRQISAATSYDAVADALSQAFGDGIITYLAYQQGGGEATGDVAEWLAQVSEQAAKLIEMLGFSPELLVKGDFGPFSGPDPTRSQASYIQHLTGAAGLPDVRSLALNEWTSGASHLAPGLAILQAAPEYLAYLVEAANVRRSELKPGKGGAPLKRDASVLFKRLVSAHQLTFGSKPMTGLSARAPGRGEEREGSGIIWTRWCCRLAADQLSKSAGAGAFAGAVRWLHGEIAGGSAAMLTKQLNEAYRAVSQPGHIEN